MRGESSVKKTNSNWLILRGMALILALWSFVMSLSAFLDGQALRPIPAVVFLAASYTVFTIVRPKSLGNWALWLFVLPGFALGGRNNKMEGQGTDNTRRPWSQDWAILVYSICIGLACSWACAFLWFSRRYAFFSGQVAGVTGLITIFYSVIAVLAGLVTGRNWRATLLVFLLAPGIVGGIVLRFHLLR
jgi:hypothetical protein